MSNGFNTQGAGRTYCNIPVIKRGSGRGAFQYQRPPSMNAQVIRRASRLHYLGHAAGYVNAPLTIQRTGERTVSGGSGSDRQGAAVQRQHSGTGEGLDRFFPSPGQAQRSVQRHGSSGQAGFPRQGEGGTFLNIQTPRSGNGSLLIQDGIPSGSEYSPRSNFQGTAFIFIRQSGCDSPSNHGARHCICRSGGQSQRAGIVGASVQFQRAFFNNNRIGGIDIAIQCQGLFSRLDQVRAVTVHGKIAVEHGVVQIVRKFDFQGTVSGGIHRQVTRAAGAGGKMPDNSLVRIGCGYVKIQGEIRVHNHLRIGIQGRNFRY